MLRVHTLVSDKVTPQRGVLKLGLAQASSVDDSVKLGDVAVRKECDKVESGAHLRGSFGLGKMEVKFG
jgi:hypothetical protein